MTRTAGASSRWFEVSDRSSPRVRGWRVWLVRLAGAGLLGAMAGIHLHLYAAGYSTVATIGPLFYLNGVLGAVVGAAVLVTPTRWFAATAAVGALLQIGTLGALVLSLTVGLFGFNETLSAPLISQTLAVESAGFLVLLVPAVIDGPALVRGVRQRARRR